jgi:hypothetical protein
MSSAYPCVFGVWQKLRIVEKDVDVKALTVIDLQHQGRTAPKRPAVDQDQLGVCLVNDAAGPVEQVAPSAGRVLDHYAARANGRG